MRVKLQYALILLIFVVNKGISKGMPPPKETSLRIIYLLGSIRRRDILHHGIGVLAGTEVLEGVFQCL